MRRTVTRYSFLLALVAALLGFLVAADPARAQDPVVDQPAPPAEAPPASGAVLEGQLFAGYSYTQADAADFGAFELGRAEAGLRGFWRDRFGLEARLEAIRSAAPQSTMGIDGDSLVLRVKRAWGHARPTTGTLPTEVRLGLIPDPWVEAVEEGYSLRPVQPLLAEFGGFFDASDLGAAAVVGYRDWVRVAAAVTNGEGRRMIEQNEGKDTSVVLTLKSPSLVLGPLGGHIARGHVAYRDGSLGPGSAKNSRLAAAATLDGEVLSLGVEGIQADGIAGDGARRALGLGAWLSVAPLPPWLSLFGRYDRIDTDRDMDAASRSLITTGASTAPPLGVPGAWRAFLVLQVERHQAQAAPLPGVVDAVDATRVLLVLATSGAWGLR